MTWYWYLLLGYGVPVCFFSVLAMVQVKKLYPASLRLNDPRTYILALLDGLLWPVNLVIIAVDGMRDSYKWRD